MNDAVRISSVTGVDVALKVAGPGARSYAFVVDWHFRALVALAWLLIGMMLTSTDVASLAPGSARLQIFILGVVLPSAAIYLLYHPVLEVAMQGRTPGKRIAGVRIVTDDGSIPGTTALLIRNVLRLLDSLPAGYLVGLITTMVTRNSVRIGDLAAGTLLVYEHGGRTTDAASLARDSNAIARHGLDRAELARELLDRWSELDSNARVRLARRLLTELGDEPPAGAGDAELAAMITSHVR